MAAKILKGEATAKDMEFETFNAGEIVINTKVASDLGLTIPDSVKSSASQTFDSVSSENNMNNHLPYIRRLIYGKY